MIINKLLAALAAPIIFINIAFAQQRIKTEADADIIEYTNKQGLPTTNISNIVQTKDGYVWLSSIEGTYRFNGYEFEEVADNSPEEIVKKLKDEGSRWVEDNDPDDDVTFVVIKVK